MAPIAALGLGGVIAWSTLLALGRGGVIWRGTFYPLDELRRRSVREWRISPEKAVGWTLQDTPEA